MWIDVHIPFDENNRLARAYNRALANGISEWVLFLDHDVFLCNPHWYEMCLEAIHSLQNDPKAVCIGCMCGGERHKQTMESGFIPTADIDYYIKESIKHYQTYGNLLQQIHEHVPGYFMLLKREIAREIGFHQVKNTINNIDQDFGNRLLKVGYHIYLMRGLYIYHRRGMKLLKKEFKT